VLRQQHSCTHQPNRATPTTFSKEQTTKARHETRNKEIIKKKGENRLRHQRTCGVVVVVGGDINGPDLQT